MSGSTLDLTGEAAPVTRRGHGTGALGPSDSSDTGSDVVGGPGMDEGLSDEQARRMPASTRGSAGRDLGDADLDSDSDRNGTGERGSASVDSGRANDERVHVEPGIESAADELDDPEALADEDSDADVEVYTPPAHSRNAPMKDGAT